MVPIKVLFDSFTMCNVQHLIVWGVWVGLIFLSRSDQRKQSDERSWSSSLLSFKLFTFHLTEGHGDWVVGLDYVH